MALIGCTPSTSRDKRLWSASSAGSPVSWKNSIAHHQANAFPNHRYQALEDTPGGSVTRTTRRSPDRSVTIVATLDGDPKV
jgi:hypothetical protein